MDIINILYLIKMKFARGGIQSIDFNKINSIDCTNSRSELVEYKKNCTNLRSELVEYNLVPMPLNIPYNYRSHINNDEPVYINKNSSKKIEKKTVQNKSELFVIRRGSDLSNR